MCNDREPEIPAQFHPVQTCQSRGQRGQAKISTKVTMAAYEVYYALLGEQKAMATSGCRGGFGTLKLIAFLYAKNFPREQWHVRFQVSTRYEIKDGPGMGKNAAVDIEKAQQALQRYRESQQREAIDNGQQAPPVPTDAAVPSGR